MAKCVLIYDDDAEILFLCKVLLTKKHYLVETFSNCENVINDITRIKPDIILMDLWIPDMGGAKAVALIKQNPAVSHIPVILFSSNNDIKDICKEINADGYIEKPFNIAAFSGVIEKNIL